MSIYGPSACREVDEETIYAKKSYVDVQDGLRLLKTGDAMSGILQMRGNLVRGLPTKYPPVYQGDEAASWGQVTEIVFQSLNTAIRLDGYYPMTGDLKMGTHQIRGVMDPDEPQDAATKNYVDSRKPLITVWAEENAAISDNDHQWSFGNGSTGKRESGYTMMAAGRIVRMGLSAVTDTSPASGSTVNVVVNGVENVSYGVCTPSGQYSGTTTFGTPLELSQGDRVNFRSASTNNSVVSAVVSLLIELDL